MSKSLMALHRRSARVSVGKRESVLMDGARRFAV
jgi:hypothetical protein|eukprot:SAG25_NODE_502_length_7356_cov_70.227642_8_plen_34_part_00